MLQIQYLNNDVTSALIPALSLRPDKIVFLYDEKETSVKRASSVERTLKKKMPGISVKCVKVSGFDFSDVAAKLTENIVPDEMLFCGIGGTEIVSSAITMVCYKLSGVPYYMDFDESAIKNVITGDVICKTANVTIDDFISALGAKKERQIREMPSKSDFKRIKNTAEWIFCHEKEWKTLCADIQAGAGKKGGLKFYAAQKSVAEALSVLEKNGFVKKVPEEANCYAAENQKVFSWLKTYGYWLEMYTYMNALEFFDEVEIGLKIDWDGSDKFLTENEIDVVGIKNSVPWFISCKMCVIEPYALHEVSNLASHFGGSHAKRMVATTKDKVSLNRKIYMDKMNVGLIEVPDFRNESPEIVFSRAGRLQ